MHKADLHLLRVFVAVVDAKGFSQAQITLNVAQSTISRQISDLEQRLGMRLCQRGRRGFSLTEEGSVVYAAAKTLFGSIETFNQTVSGTRDSLNGKLILATVDNWIFSTDAPILGALQEFIKIAPDVELELHAMAPDDIEKVVQNGHATLGLGVFHKHKPGLAYEIISTEVIGLYCSSDHPLASENDVQNFSDMLENAKLAKRAYLDEAAVAPATSSLASNAYAHQIEGVAMLILTGQYIGYLPESYAKIWLEKNRIVSIGDGRFDRKSELKIVQRLGEAPSRIHSTITNLIKANVKTKPLT